jgi:esterase/lipase superfamily enzyme
MRNFAALALAALLPLSLAGCVGDDAATVHSVWRPVDGAGTKNSVFFVTDRAADPTMPGGFGLHWAGAPSCGVARVLVPPARIAGEPLADAAIIAPPKPLDCGATRASMSAIVTAISAEAAQKHCRSVLLYVHGFNTAFYGAVGRAAQLANDAQSGCAVAAFSWSSEADIARYAADIEHSAYAVPYLEALLRDLAGSGLTVNLVAHSIGDRVTLAALSSLSERENPPRENFIGELILAAADVGVDPRNDDFAHLLRDATPFARRTTIYASAGDAVLLVSAQAHGGVPRAGREPLYDRLFQTPADGTKSHFIDVIAASDAPGDSLGHSYFALSYEAVSDITMVLAGVPASERLAPKGAWPPTLICLHTKSDSCSGPAPYYTLNVSEERAPSFISRFIKWLVPLLPRIDIQSVTDLVK